MRSNLRALPAVLFVLFAVSATGSRAVAADDDNVLKNLHTVTTIASTLPANQDVNPYGVAKVQRTVGHLTEGHILVSNFNNASNAQGTGTTIVDVAPDGTVSLFAQINASALPGPCPGGVGLTTALVALRSGWVIVGSLPTSDGTSATAQAGCLIVLDSSGNPVETFYGSLINGPWDMTSLDAGDQAWLFVTNVLNGTVAANGSVVNQGTLVRINLGVSGQNMPWIESMTVIGSGFSERTDPAALVIGPTGVGLSPNCTASDPDDCRTPWGNQGEPVLYVADALNNRIAVIPRAISRDNSDGVGTTLTSGGSLNAPLGLTVTEGGHILTVNGGDGFITEITAQGKQIAKTLLDNSGTPPGSGALFGLIFEPGRGVVFVDDATNTLNLLH
ncbi:MAG TPA: hypothetical protein VE957_13695 [Terriglobales bacterium]|nr:hypothetical protein [Terriglobales bacterium]